jgi:hypothetical protein
VSNTFRSILPIFSGVLFFVLSSVQSNAASLAKCETFDIPPQELEKIAKAPRRLIKKLAEDLSKDGLGEPCKEAIQIYASLHPEEKDLAALRAKTNKTLFKAKRKTKRLAKFQGSCQQIAAKIAHLIPANPEHSDALSQAAMALDHSNSDVHKALGRTQGKDGIWRDEQALEWFKKSNEIDSIRNRISGAKIEIKMVEAPNWVRRAAGQTAKASQIGRLQVCGLQEENVLSNRAESLYKALQFARSLESGGEAPKLEPLAHFCAGPSAEHFEAALDHLEEQKYVTFPKGARKHLNECVRFGRVGVDKTVSESEWLLRVTAASLDNRDKGSYSPGWFSAGLANYAALSMGNLKEQKELLAKNASKKEEGGEDPIPTRPEALVKNVDEPVLELLKNRRLYALRSMEFGDLNDFSPNDLAVATSFVEFLFVSGRGVGFAEKLGQAARDLSEESNDSLFQDWSKLLSKAIGVTPVKLDKEWQEWLSTSSAQSLVSTLGQIK